MKCRRWFGACPAALGIALLAASLVVLAVAGSATARSSAQSAKILYNQNNSPIDPINAFQSTAANFQLADDFYVPKGLSWRITSIFAPGADSADLGSVTVTIYRDASGSPGTQVYAVTVASGSYTDSPGSFGQYGAPNGNLTIPVNATLPAGHYWLSVVSNGSTEWYWQGRSTTSNSEAMVQWPSFTWNIVSGVWPDAGLYDLMFTLSGSVGQNGNSQGQNGNGQGQNG